MDSEILDRKAVLKQLGLKPRPEAWFLEQGLEQVKTTRNKRGPDTCFYRLSEVVAALRLEAMKWAPSKRWNFECRALGLQPAFHFMLIAEACRPDYELLRAALFLSREPSSNFLAAYAQKTEPVENGLLTSLARYVLKRVRTRLQPLDLTDSDSEGMAVDAKDRAEGYRNQPLSYAWEAVSDEMRHWSMVAAENGMKIFDGAILLREPGTGREFISRKPAYIADFENQQGQARRDYPLELFETCLMELPFPISKIPDIQKILDHASEIQYDGGRADQYEANKSDLGALISHIESTGKISAGFRGTLERILKAWNYRSKWDAEMFQRGHRKGFLPNRESLEKYEQTSTLLKKDAVSRILGGKTRKLLPS